MIFIQQPPSEAVSNMKIDAGSKQKRKRPAK